KCFLEIDAIALETPPMSGGMRGTSTLCSYLEGRKQIWPVRSHGAGIVRSDDPFTQLRPSRLLVQPEPTVPRFLPPQWKVLEVNNVAMVSMCGRVVDLFPANI